MMLFFGLFLFSGVSYAQYQSALEVPAQEPNFRFGPKIGVDLFTPTFDQSVIESQIDLNFQAGFFLQFGRKFYIQPEFYYAMRKEKSSGTTSDVTINTLNIPLMFGMRVFNLRVISAHIMAGPSASFFLKESVTSPGLERRKSNFAIQAGGGVDLLDFITLDVRYAVDLNDSMNKQIKQLGWDSSVNVTLGLKL